MAAGLHIQKERARAIFEALQDKAWTDEGLGPKLKR